MKMKKMTVLILCIFLFSAAFHQGCNTIDNTQESQTSDQKAVIKDLSKTSQASDDEKDDNDSDYIVPEIIVDIHDYEYQWDEYDGHKYADTTGSATLILNKDGDLYYFGKESPIPVVIMHDVKAFSLDDNSDTLGYTAPIAAILTKDGDLYACGDTTYDAIKDVSVVGTVPEGNDISFLEPLLINRNVKDCRADYRAIYYITDDNKLYRSKEVYLMLGEEISNPTEVKEGEDTYDYFTEHQNYNYVLSNTVQMGCGRDFFISVLEDGSVWSCFLPETDEDARYASGYGEVMGDGSEDLSIGKPVFILPPGTCF